MKTVSGVRIAAIRVQRAKDGTVELGLYEKQNGHLFHVKESPENRALKGARPSVLLETVLQRAEIGEKS